MKIIKTILSVAMISTSSVYVYGQTADEIVNKYLETVDPGKKLGKLEAVKMEMTAKSQGMETVSYTHLDVYKRQTLIIIMKTTVRFWICIRKILVEQILIHTDTA